MPGAAFVAGSYIAGLIVARKRGLRHWVGVIKRANYEVDHVSGGFITRLLTPLTFASISMIVIYPRVGRALPISPGQTDQDRLQTTRNIVVKAGGQPILDSLSEASGATSSAFESGVHTLFEGLDTVRATLSDLVGKTESAVSDSVKSAAKVIEHVPEQVTEAVHRAEDAVKHALDHPKEKPSAEFEAGADLHTRDASSYTSLEVDAADTPTGGKSPRSAVVEAVEKAEEKLEEFVEEAREALKRSMEHKKEKPTAEFEGGAELHTRGAESYTSLEVDAADTPSGKSPETPILAAVHKAEEVVEHFVEEVKELAKEAKEAVEKTLDHKREKPSVEFEGGAELHTRGPESYSSLEVDAADTPKGKSPPSVIGGAVHKAEQAVEQLVDEVKKALDSQSRSK